MKLGTSPCALLVLMTLSACTNHATVPRQSTPDSRSPSAGFVPFTSALVAKYELTNDDLLRLQYYISDKVVLRRVRESGTPRGIEDGELRGEMTVINEIIEIDSNLPGIAVNVEDGEQSLPQQFDVSFEPGSHLPFIFGLRVDQPALALLKTINTTRSVGNGGSLALERQVDLVTDEFGPVRYASNASPYLMVRESDIRRILETRRKMPGRILELE